MSRLFNGELIVSPQILVTPSPLQVCKNDLPPTLFPLRSKLGPHLRTLPGSIKRSIDARSYSRMCSCETRRGWQYRAGRAWWITRGVWAPVWYVISFNSGTVNICGSCSESNPTLESIPSGTSGQRNCTKVTKSILVKFNMALYKRLPA